MSGKSKHCTGCPLEDIGVPTDGKTSIGRMRNGFVVVTDTPSKFNADAGRLLPKGASTLLGSELASEGFQRSQFAYFPQVRCPYDQDQFTTKQKRDIQTHCRPHLIEFIKNVNPRAIIPLGAEPTRQVVGRAVKITKVRGVLNADTEFRQPVFPMLNPSMVTMYPQHLPTFQSDVRTLRALADNRFDLQLVSETKRGDYELIDDLQFLIDAKPKILSFDTENTSLRYFSKGEHDVRDYDPDTSGKGFNPSAAILTMQFCIEPGKAYMLVWDHPENPRSYREQKRLKRQLQELLCNPETKVIGQNLKYDCTYLAGLTGIRFQIGGDTLMLATLFDENSTAKNLDMLIKQDVRDMAGYADEFNATYDKSRMWEVPLDKMLEYGCGDVDGVYRLYQVQMEKLQHDKKLTQHYTYVSLPGLNALASMELRGLHINEEALDELEEIVAQDVEEKYQELMAQVPRSIKRKHIDKGLKFSRADFVLDILFRHKDGFRLKPKVFTKKTAKLPGNLRIPSTSSKDHLPYFYDECPFTQQLSDYVKANRLLGTNIRGFKNKYIIDGLVRSIYSLTTAVTGRSASEDPNGQNTPKRGKVAKAYRRVHVAPPGYFVLGADLSQAELRLAADMANEPTMLRIYREGGDIHKETALIVMGISMRQFLELSEDEQDLARFKAKAVNFGFIYGMGWRKFIGYAKTQYGVEFSEEDAQRIRDGFFAKYRGLIAWHQRMRDEAERNMQVRSYSGRIRHLPMIMSDDELVRAEAGRQAINSPIQEFASSLGIMSMGRIDREIDPQYMKIVGFVHDAIYAYVPMEYLDWAARTLKWYMETNPIQQWFGVKLKAPIVADVGFGLNFGDTFELKGLDIHRPYDYSKFWNEDEGTGILLPRQRNPANDGLLIAA